MRARLRSRALGLAWMLALVSAVIVIAPQGAAAVVLTGITVTVTDQVTGSPIAGADVEAYDYQTDVSGSGVTNASGECVLGVTPGTYDVTAFAPHYAGNGLEGAVVVDGAMTPTALALVPLKKAFTGHVEDDAGNPLIDTEVIAYHFDTEYQEWSGISGAYTDASGYYEIWLAEADPVGLYRIGANRFVTGGRLYHDGYYAASGTVATVDDASDLNRDGLSVVDNVDLVLTSEGPSGSFRVTDPLGNPIDATWFYSDMFGVEDAADNMMSTVPFIDTMTDGANGNVAIFGLDGGSYVLRFYGDGGTWAPQWFDGQRDRAGATTFSGSPTTPVALGDWAMTPSVLSIQGSVMAGGSPATATPVAAFTYEPVMREWYVWDWTLTDPSGGYEFRDLPDGDYRIGTATTSVGLTAFSPRFYNGATSVNAATSISYNGLVSRTGIDIELTSGETIDSDAFEADNTSSTATLIATNGVAQQHTFAPTGDDEDWVRFNATAGTDYMITTGPSATRPIWSSLTYANVELIDSDGTPLPYGSPAYDGSNWSIVWPADANRVVYVRVTHAFGQPGAYALAVREHSVSATIDSVSSNPVLAGSPVTLSGHGSDSFSHPITGYEWSEGGSVLSGSASFSTTSLSVGSHTIHFRARSAEGVWSERVSTTLLVNPVPTTSLSGAGVSPSKPKRGKTATFKATITPGPAAVSGTATMNLYHEETKTVRKKVKRRWKKVKVKYWKLRVTKTMSGDASGQLSAKAKVKYSGKWKMEVNYVGSGYLNSSVSKYFRVK